MASDFPEGFFDRVVENLKKQPALLVAIEVWNIAEKPARGGPLADGLLGIAATEAKRMAKQFPLPPTQEMLRKETKNDDGTNPREARQSWRDLRENHRQR